MRSYFTKYILGILVVVTILGGVSSVRADSEAVTGYAWSPNIGWIDMEGVFLDSITGRFSGYAWSQNIGWINFNGGSVISGCLNTANPTVNNNGVAFGSVRAINGTIGTDYTGCISLGTETTTRNPSANVLLSSAGSGGQKAFSGHAWGGTAIGWVSFTGVFANVGDDPVPQITAFSANPNQIASTRSVSISWDSSNTDYCDTTSFGGSTSDTTSGTESIQVQINDTTKIFSLRCYNDAGLFDSATISVVAAGSSEPACELGDPECVEAPPVPIFEEF